MAKTYSQCQSCGMPLEKGSKAGTEADGSKSAMYYELCYENGKFKDDVNLEEMKEIVDKALVEKGWWKPLRWMAIWQLPRLERWKSK